MAEWVQEPFTARSNEGHGLHAQRIEGEYILLPQDAKLMIAAISDPNPVIFLSTKGCIASISRLCPMKCTEIQIGKADG